MNQILLFGAGSGVGLELARKLRNRGVRVVALLRSAGAVDELEALGVETLRGDACRASDVTRAFDALGAAGPVVSTMGGAAGPDGSADFEGNVLVINEAVARGLERFVLVTSIGCGEMEPFMSERFRAYSGASVAAKTKAEDVLKDTPLPFTIIRPGRLLSEPETGGGILTTDPEMHGNIHRADVADLVVRALDDPATIGGVFAAVDWAMAQCVNPIEAFPLQPDRLHPQAIG